MDKIAQVNIELMVVVRALIVPLGGYRSKTNYILISHLYRRLLIIYTYD